MNRLICVNLPTCDIYFQLEGLGGGFGICTGVATCWLVRETSDNGVLDTSAVQYFLDLALLGPGVLYKSISSISLI